MMGFIADNARRALFWGVGVLFVLCILGYAYFEFHPLLLGPLITVTTPTNGATVTAALIDVTGTAKNISAISLNGRPIVVDEQGHFSEKTSIPKGYAMLTLIAQDRFGRVVTQTLELWRESTSTVATTSLPLIINASTSPSHATSSKK